MNILSKAKKILINIFFPKFCFFCSTYGSYICEKCEKEKFITYIKKYCHSCHGLLRLPGIYTHRICKKKTYIDGQFSSYVLNNNLKKYLYSIKYQYQFELLKDLSKYLRLTLSNLPINFDFITYVPLHKKRLNQRGFNQSKLLAEYISWNNKDLIIKIKNNKQQAKLSRKERKSIIKDSFVFNNSISIKNKSILICDDVYTTGATIEECAKVLKNNGAKKVYAYTIAIDLMPCDN